MNEYTLYLDESNTHINGTNKAFTIGGFIIENTKIVEIENKLNLIKAQIWHEIPNNSNIILHEKDLKDALNRRIPTNALLDEYKRFRNNANNATLLYKQMSQLVKQTDMKTIGCVVLEDQYYSNFPLNIGNEISLVCMQIILENYTHFLYNNNAIGKIVYESRDVQDNDMLMKFYQICSIGTMYVKPQAIQQKIKQLLFVPKRDNSAGLQIADFMPNQMGRKKTGLHIKPNLVDLTNNIVLKSYDGGSGNSSRYGIKVVPRMIP